MTEFIHRLSSLLNGATTALYPNLVYLIIGFAFFLFGVSRRRSH